MAVLKLGFFARNSTSLGSCAADLRTGMYPVACEKKAVLAGLVRNSTNLSALTFRSSEMRAGIASPAPPVVQPAPCGWGRNDVVNDSFPLALALMPLRSP